MKKVWLEGLAYMVTPEQFAKLHDKKSPEGRSESAAVAFLKKEKVKSVGEETEEVKAHRERVAKRREESED